MDMIAHQMMNVIVNIAIKERVRHPHLLKENVPLITTVTLEITAILKLWSANLRKKKLNNVRMISNVKIIWDATKDNALSMEL